VIRAVVFRDGHSPHIVKEEPTTMYPSLANYAACNGPEGAVSPGAAAAAAVAAVAQGNARRSILSRSHFARTADSDIYIRAHEHSNEFRNLNPALNSVRHANGSQCF
jgi:hypothetical protein